MHITDKSKLVISLIVTGKCNNHCTYCHFYANHDRKLYNRNMEFSLFERYLDFINFLKTKTKHITCRFSGGEPLVMGEELFKYSSAMFEKTGYTPYIMTNGKLLSEKVIEDCKENHISSFVVSLENPVDMDDGSIDTDKVINAYKRLQNSTIPLYLGMVIVKNEKFKDIKKICDILYDKLGEIPPICELNFLPYTSPSEEELIDLYEGLKAVIKKYYGKTSFSFFPYITPEYYSNNLNGSEYLIEFPIDDIYGFMTKTNEELLEVYEDKLNKAYFAYNCPNSSCEWHDACSRIKWVWGDRSFTVSKEQKMKDYCRFKKTISRAFLDALTDLSNSGKIEA